MTVVSWACCVRVNYGFVSDFIILHKALVEENRGMSKEVLVSGADGGGRK